MSWVQSQHLKMLYTAFLIRLGWCRELESYTYSTNMICFTFDPSAPTLALLRPCAKTEPIFALLHTGWLNKETSTGRWAVVIDFDARKFLVPPCNYTVWNSGSAGPAIHHCTVQLFPNFYRENKIVTRSGVLSCCVKYKRVFKKVRESAFA